MSQLSLTHQEANKTWMTAHPYTIPRPRFSKNIPECTTSGRSFDRLSYCPVCRNHGKIRFTPSSRHDYELGHERWVELRSMLWAEERRKKHGRQKLAAAHKPHHRPQIAAWDTIRNPLSRRFL
jgi:hypothetical protein